MPPQGPFFTCLGEITKLPPLPARDQGAGHQRQVAAERHPGAARPLDAEIRLVVELEPRAIGLDDDGRSKLALHAEAVGELALVDAVLALRVDGPCMRFGLLGELHRGSVKSLDVLSLFHCCTTLRTGPLNSTMAT